MFVGLPVPLFEIYEPTKLAGYIEPYYRPLWWEGPVLHELGLLVKVASFSTGGG